METSKELKAELTAQSMNRKNMKAYVKAYQAEAAEKAAAEAEANKPETTEQILNDIRELLKSLQPAQAAAIQKSVDKATADKQ